MSSIINSHPNSSRFDAPNNKSNDIEHRNEGSKNISITEIHHNSDDDTKAMEYNNSLTEQGHNDEDLRATLGDSHKSRIGRPVSVYDDDNEQYSGVGNVNDEPLGVSQDRDDLFALTPDQNQAFRELKLRNNEAEYDDLGGPFASLSTNHDEFGLSLDNLSPSAQVPPELSDNNNEQYLGTTFFSDDKDDQHSSRDQLFDLSPDQQQAFRELELRKQQPDFDDDYDFSLNYDQVPEYDVREKLQSLNAQLANEPLPPDAEHRNSKVVFRDEIVSLVAPADSFDASESEPEETSYTTDHSGQSNVEVEKEASDPPPVLSPDSTVTQQSTPQILTNENQRTNDNETTENEQSPPQIVENNAAELNDADNAKDDMVVSRGGKFQLLGTKDIIDESNRPVQNDDDKSSNDSDGKHRKPRPISAPASRRHHKDNSSNLDSVSSSDANSRSNSLLQKSKLQIPRVDKDALRRQQERKKKEEEESIKREEEEQNMRKDMNTKSYNVWLQTKQKLRKEEDDRKKKEEDEEKKKKERLQDERKILGEEKEKELNKKLENDRKKEDKLRQYRLKEMEDSMNVHSKAECRQAFKDWLKKKRRDHHDKLKEDRQRARITRLAMRQCRKSQDLAQAIQQSNSFRYLDFCGYP